MPIRVECSGCGKGIKAPSKYAGKSAKCPGCGNSISIPKATKESPEPSLPPQPPPVSVPSVTVVAPQSADPRPAEEQDLLKVNPAMFRTRPFATAVVFALILLTTVLAISTVSDTPQMLGIPAALLCFLVLWYLESKTTSLAITTKRSILRKGILSKRTREVRHSDVRLLQVDQSLFQRLLGVGSISIASAGHGEVEIAVSGLKNPEHVKETIDGYRN